MRRSLLLTLAMLGAVTTAVGGTSLFAALTDTATSGTNKAETGALAASADIQVANATAAASITCGAFSEDLTTPWFEATDVRPDYQSGRQYFCVRNMGSQAVNVEAFVGGLTDVDFGCTGDESANGDTTCGGDQAGEASDALQSVWINLDCATGNGSGRLIKLRDNQTDPFQIQHVSGPTRTNLIEPGRTACLVVSLEYPTVGAFSATAQQRQQAQSDRAVWHYRFAARV